MGGHIWGDAGNVEVRLRGTLHRRTVYTVRIVWGNVNLSPHMVCHTPLESYESPE